MTPYNANWHYARFIADCLEAAPTTVKAFPDGLPLSYPAACLMKRLLTIMAPLHGVSVERNALNWQVNITRPPQSPPEVPAP